MFRRIPRDHVDQTANDRDVVEEYLSARSERAFSELYRRHTPGMYALALRFVAYRTPQADDVVQEAWIRALRQLPAFRWESTLRTWLCGITVNCAREQIRENWWPAAIPDYPSSTPDQVTGLNIEQLIARLPPGYRAVLVLHDIEGYTHREIAAMLQMDEGTARSQLSRARATLRRWLSAGEKQDARRRR